MSRATARRRHAWCIRWDSRPRGVSGTSSRIPKPGCAPSASTASPRPSALGEKAVRPEAFDLAEAWRLISAEVDQLRAPVRVLAAADVSVVPLLRWVFDTQVRVGPARPDGRIDVEVAGPHVEALAGQLAGFGARVEVLEPVELRAELARIADELVATYGNHAG